MASSSQGLENKIILLFSRQILSKKENINKISNADWSV